MQLMKGRSAFACNRLLNRKGTFWQDESCDHVVSDGEFERIIPYVLNNPVKASLVTHWTEWRWNYIKPEIRIALGL